jgi:hypothetical protein
MKEYLDILLVIKFAVDKFHILITSKFIVILLLKS